MKRDVSETLSFETTAGPGQPSLAAAPCRTERFIAGSPIRSCSPTVRSNQDA